MTKTLNDLGTIAELTDSRRSALRRLSEIGVGAAIASIPFLKPGVAQAQASAEGDLGILNYALTLEYLERAFYNQANAALEDPDDPESEQIIPEEFRDLFLDIAANEAAHVTLLRAAITGAEGVPVTFTDADFDFTGFLDSFELIATLAQGLEDTGVRAYKGQAAAIENKAILTVALQIHSVEARHAAAIRRLEASPALKGWITNNDEATAPAPIAATYAGEANTTQGGVELVGALGGVYTQEEITEAFDETLSMDEVLSIAGPFLP